MSVTKAVIAALTLAAGLVTPVSAQAGSFCDGEPATIEGTSGDDDLFGTPGDDVIWTGNGNDRVWGLSGNDTICVGPGDDRVFAGGGDDLVYGGTGTDKIRGGIGNDRLNGGSGVDFLKGGDGYDELVGGDQTDRIRGGLGDDVIRGDRGVDLLWGGPGDDTIQGGPQRDLMNGGDGALDVCVVLVTPAAAQTDLHHPSCEQLTAPTPYFEQLDCVAWPTDGWPTGSPPAGVTQADLQLAIDQSLAGGPKAIVVVHGGQIVGEGYDTGVNPTDVQSSFSVSKSFTATMIAVLAQEGYLDLDAPAPVAEWSDPNDPRSAITLRHLLDMSSGLRWSESYSDPNGNFFQMLGAGDTAAYAAAQPLAHSPGQVWEYSTGTTQILARILSQTLDLYGDDLQPELERRLFDRLGQSVTLDFDDADTWFGGIVTNMTTRDFAKLGLLYLRGGVWEDRQLLDHNWVDYVRSGGPEGYYGGQFWADSDGVRYRALGFEGQGIHVLPDLDLVVAVNSSSGSGGGDVDRIKQLFEAAAPATC